MHLESIKYQIQNYFKGIKTALIIADDGSCDETLSLCRNWTQKNQNLFEEITILGDEVNRGTCRNYIKAIENLKSNLFFVLAGDDVYGYENLKNVVRLLKNSDMVSAPCPAFYTGTEGRYFIDADYNRYKTNIAIGLCPAVFRRAFTIASCLTEGPPLVYKRSLLSEDVLSFVSKYRLIEDQPLVYYLFKKRNIKMKYLDRTYVMYRVNPDSVSHTNNTAVKEIVRQDLEKMSAYYISHEKNLIYRYLALLRKYIVKGSWWLSFLLPTNHYLVIRQKIFNKKIKQYYKKSIEDACPGFLNYLQMLERRTEEFMVEVNTR